MFDKIILGLAGVSLADLSVNSREIDIDGIGLVHFRRSRRARRVIITVSSTAGVRVSVPRRTSFLKAQEFVEIKKRWIQKHLALITQNEQRRQALGQALQIVDRAGSGKKLTDRLYQLAGIHGFTCSRVTVRQQKTRWGSCSPKNTISLNVKLALLPAELSDYVILHELVHTRVHNHSKKFWAELDKYVPNSKAMAKRLRTNEMVLL
jgi:predicted metal-dependent hydrolase